MSMDNALQAVLIGIEAPEKMSRKNRGLLVCFNSKHGENCSAATETKAVGASCTEGLGTEETKLELGNATAFGATSPGQCGAAL